MNFSGNFIKNYSYLLIIIVTNIHFSIQPTVRRAERFQHGIDEFGLWGDVWSTEGGNRDEYFSVERGQPDGDACHVPRDNWWFVEPRQMWGAGGSLSLFAMLFPAILEILGVFPAPFILRYMGHQREYISPTGTPPLL